MIIIGLIVLVVLVVIGIILLTLLRTTHAQASQAFAFFLGMAPLCNRKKLSLALRRRRG
jgi:hypothetical protein